MHINFKLGRLQVIYCSTYRGSFCKRMQSKSLRQVYWGAVRMGKLELRLFRRLP